jgi:CHAT domain-containing protein
MFLSLFCLGQRESHISDSIRAVHLNRKAIQLYQNGLLIQSLDSFYLSLNLRKKIWGNSDIKLASTYNSIGIIYGQLGHLDLALQNYNSAEHNYLMADKYLLPQLISLYNNIGVIYRFKFDFEKALQYFNRAVTLSRNELNAPKEDIATYNYNIAEVYYLTNNYQKAIELINENIEVAYAEDQILYYELLAFIYQLQGDIKKSKIYYQKALDLTFSLFEPNSIGTAISFINYSNFLVSIDQLAEANEYLENAHLIINTVQSLDGLVLSEYFKIKGLISNNTPVATQNIESFRNQKNRNLFEAINWFKKGLASLRFTENYLSANTLELDNLLSLKECIILLKLIADNYNELAKLEQTNEKPVFTESMNNSIETYRLIGSLIQRARKEISDDKSKMELNALEYATFNKIIDISYTAYSITADLKYLELAFQNAERLKSSSLFDKISNQLALENSLVPDSLLNLENKLNSAITIFTEKLNNERNRVDPDSLLITEYNNEIFTATRHREELNRYIETEYKDFYELKYSNSMLSISEIQKKLNKDQVIIEYVLNETDTVAELYTFFISPDKIDFTKQIFDDGFINSIEGVFKFMSNTEYMFTKNEDSKKFCVTSNNLYKALVLPLKNHIQDKNITIVPDGKLSYIPFDALLTNLPDTSKNIEFNQLSYLIRDYCFNYSNSANLLYKQAPKARKNSKVKTLAFAPTYKTGDYIEISQKKYPLVPLPGVFKEVSNISGIIDADVFEGDLATEDNFRKNAEGYDVLHLAMHAFINDSLPAFSSLAFTQGQSDDPTKNGLLNTADIYNLRLNAKLTVLSACNTGSGKMKKGEGIMSLARGFLYAGCPAIIMSLWEVEDESGTEIITSLYKNLKKGKSKDESLRRAKLEYLNSVGSRRAHPHYWLGFVSIGDNSPLFTSYDYYFFAIVLLALFAIGIDQAIRIKKARKRRAS